MARVFASWCPNHVQTKSHQEGSIDDVGVITNLHYGREEISLHKVCDKAGFVCSADHGDSRFDGFQTEVHCIPQLVKYSHGKLNEWQLTMTAATDYLVEHGDKFRKYLVHFIESSEYGNDIGARIGVLFDQDAS